MTEKTKNKFSVQDIISIGYVYLIVLGIISDLIFYKFLGINILYYSDILDIILTPINILATNIPVFVVFAVLMIVSHYALKKGENIIPVLSIVVLFLFLGFAVGKGVKYKSLVADQKFKASHELTFMNGDSQSVKLVGQKGSFVFYLSKGEMQISVSPIENTIIKIQRLETELMNDSKTSEKNSSKPE